MSLLQAIDAVFGYVPAGGSVKLLNTSYHPKCKPLMTVVFLARLSQVVVSQAPQHFVSSKMQATYDGCFSRQTISGGSVSSCSILNIFRNASHVSRLFLDSLICSFIPLTVACTGHGDLRLHAKTFLGG